MKLKIKQKFPCGYELEIMGSSWRGVEFNDLKVGICPLHGKKCVGVMRRKDE